MKLLTLNTKLQKSLNKYGADILTAGLSLAPHRRSGYNVCDNAGFCSAVCQLWFSGRTNTDVVRNAMLRRTRLLFEDRPTFDSILRADLNAILRKSQKEGKRPYVRLNVASDLDWREVIADFPDIRFYDYSKIGSRCLEAAHGKLPANWWITPSWSERMHANSFHAYLRAGLNVAVVFDTAYCPPHGIAGTLPHSFKGWPVIDGDTHDLRHPDYDGRGRVIGLRFKGGRKLLAQARERGFVVSGQAA